MEREQPLRKKKTYSENLFPKVVCSLRSASLKMMVQRKKVKWLTGERVVAMGDQYPLG